MRRLKVTTLAIFAALVVVALLGVEKLAVGEDADPVLVGAGDIASCQSTGDEATASLLEGINGTAVATLGDNAYESGTSNEFANCYDNLKLATDGGGVFDPARNYYWGKYKALTKPAVGNHEYNTAGASGYFGYFGAAAGDPQKGYYSYPLGTWHIIALNSMCQNVGGCGASSPMVTWLKGDLAANPSSCTLAYWHHPVFSSGAEHGNNPKMIPSWDALYAAGAEVVLSGHDHDYERFAPQTSSGVADSTQGIREFVVGTGGRSHYPFGTIRANSEVRNSDTYGVLKLTLHASSYDWQFVPEAGKTFTDSGSGICHSAPPNPTDPVPGSPTVVSTVPSSGAMGVSPSINNIKATFSEAMDASTADGDPSTITPTTFMLFPNGSTTQVAAKVSYDSSTSTAKLNPNNNLQRGVTYRAVLTTGVQDVAGNPLVQQIEWLFTVKR